jgi:hypothetical protein
MVSGGYDSALSPAPVREGHGGAARGMVLCVRAVGANLRRWQTRDLDVTHRALETLRTEVEQAVGPLTRSGHVPPFSHDVLLVTDCRDEPLAVVEAVLGLLPADLGMAAGIASGATAAINGDGTACRVTAEAHALAHMARPNQLLVGPELRSMLEPHGDRLQILPSEPAERAPLGLANPTTVSQVAEAGTSTAPAQIVNFPMLRADLEHLEWTTANLAAQQGTAYTHARQLAERDTFDELALVEGDVTSLEVWTSKITEAFSKSMELPRVTDLETKLATLQINQRRVSEHLTRYKAAESVERAAIAWALWEHTLKWYRSLEAIHTSARAWIREGDKELGLTFWITRAT